MPYEVQIRNNATGEVRACSMGPRMEWNDGSMFWWTDGNFGCDCNRALEWHRAGGIELGDEVLECGHDAFTAIEAVLSDGRRIPIDAADP